MRRLLSFLFRLILLPLALLAAYWGGTYFWPRWVGRPSLAGGLVSLGAPEAEAQRVWLHCAQECREAAGINSTDWSAKLVVEFASAADSASEHAAVQRCAPDSPASVCEWRAAGADAWVVTLRGLSPCTRYRYRAALGSHTLGRSTLKVPRAEGASGWFQFRTTPHPDADGCPADYAVAAGGTSGHELAPVFQFQWGSCLGLSPFSDLRAFRWLLSRPPPARSDLVVLLGDIVYTDIPTLDDLTAYAQIWSDPAFSELFQQVPFLGMYDDHEIINDWSVLHSHDRYQVAMSFFDTWVGSKNPPPPGWHLPTPEPSSPPLPASLTLPPAALRKRYYTHRHGRHAAFFVLDTRQYASPTLSGADAVGAAAHDPSRTKLGAAQLASLLHWLRTETATFKFVCSSVAFADATLKVVQDGWAAYAAERETILRFIARHRIPGVMLLSADLHYAALFELGSARNDPQVAASRGKSWHGSRELTVSPIQSFPLPHYLARMPHERTAWSSPMQMHIGEIAVHAPTDAAPYINASVYTYWYGEPRVALRQIWTADDLLPPPLTDEDAQPEQATSEQKQTQPEDEHVKEEL